MSKTFEVTKTRAGVMILGAAMLAALPVVAQQDAPPPPPQGQMQGPPSGGMQGGRGGMNPERRVEMMQRELNLTPAQTMQVKGILEEGRGKTEALQADQTLSQDEKRMRMMEIRKHESEHVRAVLTPDQQPKYDAMLEKQRERMRDRRDGGPGGPPPPSSPSAPPQQ